MKTPTSSKSRHRRSSRNLLSCFQLNELPRKPEDLQARQGGCTSSAELLGRHSVHLATSLAERSSTLDRTSSILISVLNSDHRHTEHLAQLWAERRLLALPLHQQFLRRRRQFQQRSLNFRFLSTVTIQRKTNLYDPTAGGKLFSTEIWETF